MDSRDAEILATLMRNCRRPMRELAEQLAISVTAVHKRVTVLEESGIIRRFICLIHPGVIGATSVLVHGHCDRPITVAGCRELGADPRVFEVDVASGNYLQLTAVLRHPSELDELVARVREMTGMQQCEVHHHNLGPVPDHRLDATDCAIALALRFDARRSATGLAKSLGSSERSIRARVDRLTKSGCLMLWPDLDVGASGDQWAMLHLQTHGVVDPESLLTVPGPAIESRAIWAAGFEDAPSTVLLNVWSGTLDALRQFQERSLTRPEVSGATAHLVIASDFFPVWIDDYLRRRIAGMTG